MWVKLGFGSGDGNIYALWGADTGSSTSGDNYGTLNSARKWSDYVERNNGTWGMSATVQGVARDPSAWYHYLLSYNQPNGATLWINGVQQTYTYSNGGSSSGGNFGSEASQWNRNSVTGSIGAAYTTNGYSNFHWQGYIAEVHHLDGTAVSDQYDFGEFDSNGIWRPIEYTGSSYGNQGFYLKFDPSASNGIGHDHSGNGNNWTATGFTTSGTGTDVMSDTPTTNWCTLNPLAKSNGTLSEGNLRWQPSGNNASAWSTFAVNSGKWYWEVTKNSGDMALMLSQEPKFNGFQPDNVTTALSARMYYSNGSSSTNSFKYNSTSTAFPSGFGDDTNGNIYSFMLDFDAGTFKIRRNNDSGTEASFTMPAALTAKPLHIGYSVASTWPSGDFTYNFGQRAFAYTPPSGHLALNTSNLPAPDIADGSDYFGADLWTGNDATRDITVADSQGNTWAPDLVWIKMRNNTMSHYWYDTVRGATKSISSDSTRAETTDVGRLTAFNTDGFELGSSSRVNSSPNTYVGWSWLAGGSGSSNTDGSITSTVSANPSAGFSIVSYTGSGSNATVGHGLGVAPGMVIIKSRSNATEWIVYHSGIGATKFLNLDGTGGEATNSSVFNDTAPTSTTFAVGTVDAVNYNNYTYVAYCFAEVEGYSKFGSYTGNGSTDGVFIYTGFKPAVLIYKRTDNAQPWYMLDTTRDPYNVSYKLLVPNSSAAEDTGSSPVLDFLSNGYKMRNSYNTANASGGTYIFAAFAENPFGGEGVSPATAR